jgi:hypothetical protein
LLRSGHRVATEGGREAVQVKRLISKRIRRTAPGLNLAADVNAEISVNVAEGRSTRTGPSTPPPRPGARPDERGKETQ